MGDRNFSRVPLGDVVRNVRGGIKPADMEKDADYILLEHIQPGTGIVHPVKVKEQSVGSNKSAFDEGDILFGKLRPNLRKVCVATARGYCSTDIIPLRAHQQGASYYLAAVLRSERFTTEVLRMVSGANLPRIGVKDLLSFEIPWPDEGNLQRLERTCREAITLRRKVDSLSRCISNFESSLWET